MKTNCTHFNPSKTAFYDLMPGNAGPNLRIIVRNGSFFRKSDSKRVSRYYCRICRKHFSRASFQVCFGQKKRRVNTPLQKLLVSGVSQRRAAILLKIDSKTVARKLKFLADQARLKHEDWLKQFELNPINSIQFDDLETSEHSKCKPLSVSLAVDPSSRKIIGFQVSQMPAKGYLASIARRRYGFRKDERSKGWNELMKALKPMVTSNVLFTSDENPHYPKYIFRHHPSATHETTPGRRGCVVGQGELKRGGFDPLFTLNHTCAMLRANLNRLFRRTWCTTKKRQGLIDHLSLYMVYHNQVLTPSAA